MPIEGPGLTLMIATERNHWWWHCALEADTAVRLGVAAGGDEAGIAGGRVRAALADITVRPPAARGEVLGE